VGVGGWGGGRRRRVCWGGGGASVGGVWCANACLCVCTLWSGRGLSRCGGRRGRAMRHCRRVVHVHARATRARAHTRARPRPRPRPRAHRMTAARGGASMKSKPSTSAMPSA
jgi:hypothetical protein